MSHDEICSTILARAQRIPWSGFDVCPGMEGNDFPWAIANLVNPSREVRMKAYWMLDNVAIVQSGLYSSAYVVTKLLLELLAMEPAAGKLEIYDFLIQAAVGDPVNKTVRIDGELFPLKDAILRLLVDGRLLFERDAIADDPQISTNARSLISEIKYQITGEDDGG